MPECKLGEVCVMNDKYKLAPVEPTIEMAFAGIEVYGNEECADADVHSAWEAMIAAAPAVQGEAVATIHVDGSFVHVAWRIPAPSRCEMDVYTAPQPAEQQPIPSSLAYDASIHLTNWLNMNLCECEGGHTCGYNEVRRTRDALLAVAEKKQDITQLVEALEWLRGAINCTPENDKHQSGAWISTKHPRIRQIDELLAAFRKQGGDV